MCCAGGGGFFLLSIFGQPLVGSTEIEILVVLVGGHLVVELLGHSTEHDGGLSIDSSVDGKAKILGHQGHAESTSVTTSGSRVLLDTRARVVDLTAPAATAGGIEDSSKELGVHAHADTEVHGLGGGDHRDSEEHVVADLGNLSVAVGAAVDNVLAHLLEVGLGQLEIGVGV